MSLCRFRSPIGPPHPARRAGALLCAPATLVCFRPCEYLALACAFCSAPTPLTQKVGTAASNIHSLHVQPNIASLPSDIDLTYRTAGLRGDGGAAATPREVAGTAPSSRLIRAPSRSPQGNGRASGSLLHAVAGLHALTASGLTRFTSTRCSFRQYSGSAWLPRDAPRAGSGAALAPRGLDAAPTRPDAARPRARLRFAARLGMLSFPVGSRPSPVQCFLLLSSLLSVCLCACACDPFSRAEFGREDASGDLLVRLEGLVGGSGVAGGGGGAGVPNMTMGVSVAGNMGGCEEVGVVSCPVCSKRVQLSYLSLHLKRTHDSLEVRCPLCAKMFKNKHSLSVHQARYHPRNIHTVPMGGAPSSSSTPVSPSGHHALQPHRPATPTYLQPPSSNQLHQNQQQIPSTPTPPGASPRVSPTGPPPLRPLGSGTTPTQRRARPNANSAHLSAHTRHNLLTASGTPPTPPTTAHAPPTQSLAMLFIHKDVFSWYRHLRPVIKELSADWRRHMQLSSQPGSAGSLTRRWGCISKKHDFLTPLITLLLPSGLDLLRAFEYGATVTDLGLHGGALGGTYLDARGGGLPSGVCGAGGGGGAPGGGGPGGGVPWRRPLGGSDGYVSCPQCQKPITSYNLNRHVRMVHSNMEHATCPVCSKEFKNKYSLATHMHRQHSDPGGASGQPRTTTCSHEWSVSSQPLHALFASQVGHALADAGQPQPPHSFDPEEQDEYNGDGDGEDRVREAQQIEKKERITLIKQQFALRRKGAQRGGSSGSSSSYTRLNVGTRESYLQLVVQALVKNYEACKHLSPVEKNLKESDIEDVAVKLEYSIFTSTNVIMIYRKGMMSLMMGIRKDTTALNLRNELADHEPKLSLNQWAKQVEKELKNKNKVGSGFKSASQLMDEKAEESSKTANKEPPNLSTRRGFSLKRSPNHQTSINSFFGKAPQGDSKKKDHQLSESESEGDDNNGEGNSVQDKEEIQEDMEGKQGEDAQRSPQSYKERYLDSDCDSRYDPDENQEFGVDEVSLSDLECDDEDDDRDVRIIPDDGVKESEKKENKDDMSYDFPESEGFTCDKGDEVSISREEVICDEESNQDTDMKDVDISDETKCADDMLKTDEDKDMLQNSFSGEKENVNSTEHGTTFRNSPLKDEDSYMEYSHNKNSDLHNKRSPSPNNQDTSRGQKRTMEEDKASGKTSTRKRTKLTEIDLFGNTDSQQSDSEPESESRSSTKENRHQSEKDSKHKGDNSKSRSSKHSHKDDTSASKGRSRRETSKGEKKLKEIDLFGEADRDCESEGQQNERGVSDRKRNDRRIEVKSMRNEETHKKSSRSRESEHRHSKDERRSDKSRHDDDRRKSERDIKEREKQNEKKNNFTFKSFKTDNRNDSESRPKLPDETTYRKINNFEVGVNREKEKQEYNRKEHKPREEDESSQRKSSDSKERKQNENIERITSPRNDRKTSERKERRTSENKEVKASEENVRRGSEAKEKRASEGKERRPSEGKERRPSEGKERRASEGKERRASEGKERRATDGREKRTVESKERTPSETRERKASNSSCQILEPTETATKLGMSVDMHKIDLCLVEKSKPKPMPAPVSKNPPVNKKLIADWVVKHLMPHYKNESIRGKEVFKALARQLSHHISNQGVIREDDEVKQYVNGFFKRVKNVSSEADIVLE
ncbi:hypothetical protein C7M84_016011 [Penaeus vannamei]|uniref:C2H2-type domain-containing protein n=1 Tax=Penaeus vannamei TaxID=6689 RepID=A0A3R7QFQ9_PENVA|nr:hypothetical protein C7M84_016011 [Penaeus vannamei]